MSSMSLSASDLSSTLHANDSWVEMCSTSFTFAKCPLPICFTSSKIPQKSWSSCKPGDWPANGEPTILELLRWKPTVLRGGSTAAAASIEGAASVLGDVLSDVLAALFMARGLRERGSASSATLARPPRRTTQL